MQMLCMTLYIIYNILFIYRCIYNIIWGSLVVKLPSSLPWRVGGGHFPRFSARDLPALTSLKRYVSRGLWRVPRPRSHLKRFWLKLVLSFGSGAHVFSRPRFFSSGSALAALECKSLQVYSMFCVILSNTTVKAHWNHTLCVRKGTFEFLAAVL